MRATFSWTAAQACAQHSAFASVRHAWRKLPTERWPSLDVLNALIAGTANIRHAKLRFVEPPKGPSLTAADYEWRIALRGEIPTRDNWHDLFNALAWASWPQAKSAISELHARLVESGGAREARQRGTRRDALTLFDESGAIVLAESARLLDAIRGFRWREAFIDRRDDWKTRATVLSVGHALMEKMLVPHIGITAKCLLLEVPTGTLRALAQPDIDARIARLIFDGSALCASRDLAPLPVLGIPGWDLRNESPAFYDNTDYFRPGRMRDRPRSAAADA